MNYLKWAELTVTRKSCDLQELVDGIADDWSFAVRLPTQRGGATWAANFSRIFTWMSTPTPVGMVMNRVSADMTAA